VINYALLAEGTLKVIQDYRKYTENKFKEIFNEASLITNTNQVDIVRLVKNICRMSKPGSFEHSI